MKDIKRAWDYIFKSLWWPKTKLIYDYRSEVSMDGMIRHLPTPEEIAEVIPNPCGWGTGMEDSVLNGSSMIEAVLAEYKLTGDESLHTVLAELYEGLLHCATVSHMPGYLARSVHPIDGRSHYPNSSRDQYTHWVFLGCRLFDSPMATEEMRESIKKVLLSFARKAEIENTAAFGYSYSREDGAPAFCCELTGKLEPHEVFRLPMIYLGAYHVSGDAHWKDCYRAVREWAISESEKVKFAYPWAYCLLQMQYSLRIGWEVEEDEAYKSRLAALLDRIAEGAMSYADKTFRIFLDAEEMPEQPSVLPAWRSIPFDYFFKKPLYGRPYFVPQVYNHDPLRQVLRNGAEAMIIQALAPGRAVSPDQADAFFRLTKRLDFDKASNYWPVLWYDAWWMLKSRGAF